MNFQKSIQSEFSRLKVVKIKPAQKGSDFQLKEKGSDFLLTSKKGQNILVLSLIFDRQIQFTFSRLFR